MACRSTSMLLLLIVVHEALRFRRDGVYRRWANG